MKTITSNNRTWGFVEVPEGATDIHVDEYTAHRILMYLLGLRYYGTQLPNANYRLHAISDAITEEEAACVVERYKDKGYCWYEFGGKLDKYWCEHAHISFSSFKVAHNLTGRYAILEIINN